MSTEVIEYVRENRDHYVSELKEYLSIPSISTLPENKKDVEAAARWLKAQLESIGMERVEIMDTGGHPVVRGDWLKASSGKPTVLVYGHYDVQPVDPLDQWTTSPFDPTIKGEYIFARGAADMKGQGHALLKALESWSKKTSTIPVNVKILFEGEEEIGSPNLESFIERNKEELASSFCLNCDAAIARPDMPSLTYGLRGVLYYEIWVHGPRSDLHSGSFGGIVHNPAVVLSELIAGLHDRDGRVTLRGFYDNVRKLSDEERREIVANGFSDDEWREAAGVTRFYGEKGFSQSERVWVRPALDVNGMVSGFTGHGQKR
jgi:acetylornithine deacetylase/succinyl-diaminopimelate desuccinylase-like protein